MGLGYDKKLYMCAFDHRGSFEKLFGVEGRAPTDEEHGRISDAKTLIYEGYRQAIDAGADRQAGGILVDATYGPDVARRAKEDGFNLAMPAEKSGQAEFDFEYGDDFGKEIERWDPTFCKVLVRYNPAGDESMNARQTERLKRLADWLHERDRKFMFELLVPAEPAQLESVGGSADRYDTELRPKLMMDTIERFQDAGVEADIWKIEGIADREACRQIAELARRGGRDQVSCIVLGRGASDEMVDTWLRAGAGLPGYIGFAIGRSIFNDAVKQAAANGGFDRQKGIDSVAQRYKRFIDVYEQGETESSG
jgi:myo-inositol catabolism protein IolC